MSYLTKNEDYSIRKILEATARSIGLEGKNEYYISSSLVDYVWFKDIEGKKIPIIAFEIERGIPTNERLKKDIFNLLITKAPAGFLIIAKSRIDRDEGKNPWIKWFRNTFPETFKDYTEPFSSFIKIELLDGDKLLLTKSIEKSKII